MSKEKLPLNKWIKVGMCPVDSGQIMLVDPCYVLADGKAKGYSYKKLIDQWDYATKDIVKSKVLNPIFSGIAGEGVVVSSGLGDGCYAVYAKFTDIGDGDIRIAEVKIKFLPHSLLGNDLSKLGGV